MLHALHKIVLFLTGKRSLLNGTPEPDPRIAALSKRSATKDAYRQALVRGDTREQGRLAVQLEADTRALLALEVGK